MISALNIPLKGVKLIHFQKSTAIHAGTSVPHKLRLSMLIFRCKENLRVETIPDALQNGKKIKTNRSSNVQKWRPLLPPHQISHQYSRGLASTAPLNDG